MVVKVDGNEVNFGNIKFGQTYTRDYKVSNYTPHGIRIENLGKSCTCTNITALNPEPKSGDTCIIKVDITPGSTGLFARSFWFDAGGQHYHVTVKAKVE